ncbi:MAG: type I-E CRISPR-associated protein Cse2/CasB [Akkermansia sp.]|nr:type I-E CRISPR-associated protein Cse2/CasB [Akkermansia sp.]
MNNKLNIMEFLRRYRDNRGAMAALRYLLKSGAKMRGWQIISKINGIGDCVIETIAGLYGLHPLEKTDNKYNFGDACRALSLLRKKNVSIYTEDETDDMKSPFDSRFRRLLACDTREELCLHLVDVVRGLKSENIPINYESLCSDIKYWGERVREKWAVHYWCNRKEDSENVSD